MYSLLFIEIDICVLCFSSLTLQPPKRKLDNINYL